MASRTSVGLHDGLTPRYRDFLQGGNEPLHGRRREPKAPSALLMAYRGPLALEVSTGGIVFLDWPVHAPHHLPGAIRLFTGDL